MKLTPLVLGVTILASSLSFAQRRRNDDRSGNVNRAMQLKNVSESIALLSEAFIRNQRSLDLQELNKLERRLNKTTDMINGLIPFPQGGGNNPQPIPPRTNEFSVRGKIEDRISFDYIVYDGIDLVDQCLETYTQSRLGNSDEFSASYNYGPLQDTRTSGYWETGLEMCAALLKKSYDNGLVSIPRFDFVVHLSIENRAAVKLVGDLPSIVRQCEKVYTDLRFGSTDEFTMIVNGAKTYEVRTSGYWTNNFEMCSAMTSKLRQ